MPITSANPPQSKVAYGFGPNVMKQYNASRSSAMPTSKTIEAVRQSSATRYQRRAEMRRLIRHCREGKNDGSPVTLLILSRSKFPKWKTCDQFQGDRH
jgi:hypothetical protein